MAEPSGAERAWETYHDAVRDGLARFLAVPECADPKVRAQAHYFLQVLQTAAFGLYVAPRHQYPALYVHSVFLPFELGWGLPCADFLYRWCSIDGAHTYRLWGRRGTTHWLHAQFNAGFWGDESSKNIANLDFDTIEYGPDGAFEVILSADRHEGNWVKLDRDAHNIVINMRETSLDWEGEIGTDIRIECLDRDPRARILMDEDEVALRIEKAARFIAYHIDFSFNSTKIIVDRGGRDGDVFAFLSLDAPEVIGDKGGNPEAVYLDYIYDIQPGEAYIIESEMPDALYWSLQLSDYWWHNLDYSHHQSALNDKQARRDADGKIRLVLSLEDPGVPNWIDAQDPGVGMAQWRWYRTEKRVVPTVRKVPLAQLRDHLPADTPYVFAEERQATLLRRRDASLRRYGF
ncbi:MAG: DUF1214 domain-containing protein [Sphingomonadaceae bacterium]|nr:DUF1214 domain-containing protein [Sphingomonadaceae bacterium]